MDEQILLTIKDAQRRLRLGRTKIYELVNAGELQAVKIGFARRITQSSLLAFAARLLQQVSQ
ncbi:MAG TPA: helix-turn-helix domain-containing protein [Rhizomicrobium sp.]|nr:helix-turn-helix domain-containing protein [Rhizomicrobium sp.]